MNKDARQKQQETNKQIFKNTTSQLQFMENFESLFEKSHGESYKGVHC